MSDAAHQRVADRMRAGEIRREAEEVQVVPMRLSCHAAAMPMGFAALGSRMAARQVTATARLIGALLSAARPGPRRSR
jgi:hypothetical protein